MAECLYPDGTCADDDRARWRGLMVNAGWIDANPMQHRWDQWSCMKEPMWTC